MDAHMTFAIVVSIFGMLIGFGLLFWVSWRKAGDRHEFSLVRMLGLLFGCMLVPTPLAVGAWLTRADGGILFQVLALSALLVGLFSPHLVLHIIKWIRGDAQQFVK
jgi:hypothetical protein